MLEDLEKLVRLQHVETDLKHAEAALAAVPHSKAELEARAIEERRALDTARAALAASQKARRQYEGELQELETRRSKYKGQLMEVKTNKEYTAVLHEIEGVEREIRSREDQVLQEMERAEALAGEIKAEEALFKAAEARLKAEGQELERKAQELAQDSKRLTAERETAAAAVPEELLTMFQRVAKLRGAGVAEAKDGVCQECQVKLRLQMYVDVKRNDSILQCPSCSRVLYYAGPVTVIVPVP